MKYLPLLWAGLWRSKPRTFFTLASIAVSFLLYALLGAVNGAFASGGLKVSGTDRLLVTAGRPFLETLPLAVEASIAQTPGVAASSVAEFMDARTGAEDQGFGLLATDPVARFATLPELQLPPAQMRKWLHTRDGMVVGADLARDRGWTLGQRLPVRSSWPKKDGTQVWNFEIVGIFTATTETSRTNGAYVRYDYFDEARSAGNGQVRLVVVRLADGADAVAAARRLERRFANSRDPVRAQTEGEFVQGFTRQIGDIGLIVAGISGAVFFTLLILTGNTMMQSVRERVPELAVLKTLGFTDTQVMGFVLAEAGLLCGLGAALGVGLGFLVTASLAASLGSLFRAFVMPPGVAGQAALAALVLALLVGIPPAVRALRLSIVDALAGR